MKNLFAYGTLMCEEIFYSVTGCHGSQQPAVLMNYRRHLVKGEVYPGIIKSINGIVEGVLYSDLPESAWRRLDHFEGEMYERCTVTVNLSNGQKEKANTYVIKPKFMTCLDEGDWNFKAFLKNTKRSFISKYF